MARERNLDLVEISPTANPPVCRIMDYGKFLYQQEKKEREAKKHQKTITVKEVKFRINVDDHDYETKKNHVLRFLKGDDRVKVTIMFRGREVTHPERGTALLEKLAGELSEIAVVEQTPLQDGRNMTMMLAPSKAVLAGEKDGKAPTGEAAEAEPEAGAEAAAATGDTDGQQNGKSDVPAPAPSDADAPAPAPSDAAA